MAEPASNLRSLVEALALWVREETGRTGERAADTVGAALRELGFVTRAEHDDLALRVAQLEHRLRLLEVASGDAAGARAPASGAARIEPAPPSTPTS